MSEKSCLNCESPLEKGQKFCPRCGQSAKVKRLSLREVRKELQAKFLHADAGIVHLTRELALRPGAVALEYVQGKRKKYYSPLKYLTLSAAVSVFLNQYFHLMEITPGHTNPGTEIAARYFNLIILLSVPVSAFFSRLLYRKKGFNFAENLALHAYIGGFRVVFFILIFTPLVIWHREYYYICLFIYILGWLVYSAWAQVQFFGGPAWLTVLKAILILLLNQWVVSIGIMAAIITQRMLK